MKIKVIKRDGKLEDFQKEKIAKVTKAAGLTSDEAKKLSEKIGKWAEERKQQQISTLTIRDKVIEELKKIDEFAHNAYIWYQKTKDKGLNLGK